METTVKTIHHNDCTWCKFRKSFRDAKRHEVELCKLTNTEIPPPYSKTQRYCEDYQQENCPCEKCNK